LDPLSTAVPPPSEPLGPSEEEKKAFLTTRQTREAAKQRALDDLVAAVEAYRGAIAESGDSAHAVHAPAVLAAVKAAEQEGVPVDRHALVAQGIIAPVHEEVDLDSAPAEKLEIVHDLTPEPDPLELRFKKEPFRPTSTEVAEIPIYNPTAGVVEAGFDAARYAVRPRGVDFVPAGAAHLLVGEDNSGGTHSHFGVRRLYGPEPRFNAQASAEGVSTEEYARKRNAEIKSEADAVYAGVSAEIEKPINAANAKLNQG
jgi:hypothetical protein